MNHLIKINAYCRDVVNAEEFALYFVRKWNENATKLTD